MKRREFIANMIVGGIGALGQGVLLAHTLDSYPFAILTSPPEKLYSSVGWMLAVVAPLVSLLFLYVFRAMPRPFVTAIPVVACPLVFWLLFRLVFTLSGYRYAPPGKGNDLVATKAIETGFSSEVVSLALLGLMSGLGCGLFLWFLFARVLDRKLA
ncbi:MAG TPA: hypothetical protein VE961_21795 [Pyrinomonadaceae bacterium]|nr:hypothetical protein [Pyrinomonadaceae bacterium]